MVIKYISLSTKENETLIYKKKATPWIKATIIFKVAKSVLITFLTPQFHCSIYFVISNGNLPKKDLPRKVLFADK